MKIQIQSMRAKIIALICILSLFVFVIHFVKVAHSIQGGNEGVEEKDTVYLDYDPTDTLGHGLNLLAYGTDFTPDQIVRNEARGNEPALDFGINDKNECLQVLKNKKNTNSTNIKFSSGIKNWQRLVTQSDNENFEFGDLLSKGVSARAFAASNAKLKRVKLVQHNGQLQEIAENQAVDDGDVLVGTDIKYEYAEVGEAGKNPDKVRVLTSDDIKNAMAGSGIKSVSLEFQKLERNESDDYFQSSSTVDRYDYILQQNPKKLECTDPSIYRKNISDGLAEDIENQIDPEDLIRMWGEYIVTSVSYGAKSVVNYESHETTTNNINEKANEFHSNFFGITSDNEDKSNEDRNNFKKNGEFSIRGVGGMGPVAYNPTSKDNDSFLKAYTKWTQNALTVPEYLMSFVGIPENNLSKDGVYIWDLIDPEIMTGKMQKVTVCVKKYWDGTCEKEEQKDELVGAKYFTSDKDACSQTQDNDAYNFCLSHLGKRMSYADYVKAVYMGLLIGNGKEFLISSTPTISGWYIKDIYFGQSTCSEKDTYEAASAMTKYYFYGGKKPVASKYNHQDPFDTSHFTPEWQRNNLACHPKTKTVGSQTGIEIASADLVKKMQKDCSNSKYRCVMLNHGGEMSLNASHNTPNHIYNIDGDYHADTLLGYVLTQDINESIVGVNLLKSDTPITNCDNGVMLTEGNVSNYDKPYCSSSDSNPVNLRAGMEYLSSAFAKTEYETEQCSYCMPFDESRITDTVYSKEGPYIYLSVKRYNPEIPLRRNPTTGTISDANRPIRALGIFDKYTKKYYPTSDEPVYGVRSDNDPEALNVDESFCRLLEQIDKWNDLQINLNQGNSDGDETNLIYSK